MQGKGALKLHNKGKIHGTATQDNSLRPQENNNTMKKKKDIGKWCDYHKSPTHNKSECRAMQSLVADMKASEWYGCSNSEL